MSALSRAKQRLNDYRESRKRTRAVERHAKRNKLDRVERKAGELIDVQDTTIARTKERIDHLTELRQSHRVIPRSEWGARPPRAVSPLSSTSNGVFIHHTVGSSPSTPAAERNEMRNIQNFHMNSRGWNDIAYSFVVASSGRIYEARGKGVAGAHTEGYNSTSYAICFMGNFETQAPSSQAIAAARWLRREYLRLGNAPLRGHRQVNSTACPGAKLFARIGEL